MSSVPNPAWDRFGVEYNARKEMVSFRRLAPTETPDSTDPSILNKVQFKN